MNRHRQRWEVWAEILNLCDEPQAKTRIAYGVETGHNQVEEFLEEMTGLDLLCHDKGSWTVTGRGRNFLVHVQALWGLSRTCRYCGLFIRPEDCLFYQTGAVCKYQKDPPGGA